MNGEARRVSPGIRRFGGGALLLGTALAVAVGWGIVRHDFWGEGAQLLDLYWGRVTLFDFYIGVALVCGWILHRERRPRDAIVWIAGVVLLGHIVTCAYVWWASRSGRPERFWHGAQSSWDIRRDSR